MVFLVSSVLSVLTLFFLVVVRKCLSSLWCSLLLGLKRGWLVCRCFFVCVMSWWLLVWLWLIILVICG